MSNLKGSLMFLLKSFAFSFVFVCTTFSLYFLTTLNTSSKKITSPSEATYLAEYNRQIAESAKLIQRQNDITIRAEAVIAKEEANAKRMSAVLDALERQSKK